MTDRKQVQLRRAGLALRLKREGKSLMEIARVLGRASGSGAITRERARQIASKGERVAAALEHRLSTWERRLEAADVDKGHPLWHYLAHARSEWSMGCFHVALGDLERMESDPTIATRHISEVAP